MTGRPGGQSSYVDSSLEAEQVGYEKADRSRPISKKKRIGLERISWLPLL